MTKCAHLYYRTIRSFVLRQRCTTAQQDETFDRLWSIYGVSALDEPFNCKDIFARSAPCFLEIGFGKGEVLLETAKANPGYNYLGMEVYRPGVRHLLNHLSEQHINNVRVLIGDAVHRLTHLFPDASLAGIQILFPDPWPKRRHHKRRLVNTACLLLLESKLQLGGSFQMVTDCQDYAESVIDCLSTIEAFKCTAQLRMISSRLASMSQPVYLSSKYAKKAQRLGHTIYFIEASKGRLKIAI